MATRSDSLPSWVLGALATYSLPVYAIGLLAIVLTRVLEGRVGVPFPPRLRGAVVVAALAVMVVTYLAERKYAGEDGGPADGDTAAGDGYSLYARAGMAAAAIGVGAGIYVGAALEAPFVGALFIFGAYLFVYMAYRYEGREAE